MRQFIALAYLHHNQNPVDHQVMACEAMQEIQPELTDVKSSTKEKFFNVLKFSERRGAEGVPQSSQLMKVDTSDHHLDHIFTHFQKEFRHVLPDSTQSLKASTQF